MADCFLVSTAIKLERQTGRKKIIYVLYEWLIQVDLTSSTPNLKSYTTVSVWAEQMYLIYIGHFFTLAALHLCNRENALQRAPDSR